MNSRASLVPWAIAIALLSLSMSAAGAVDWDDEVTDPRGDVVNSLNNPVSGREDIDILSVIVVDTGTGLNVTLGLAGRLNASAEYTVDLLADGTASYRLSWEGAFAAKGPSGAPIDVTGHASRDGTTLSWSLAKSSVAASSYVRVDEARSELAVPGGMPCLDVAKGTPHQGEVPLPRSISVKVAYETLSLRNVTITVTYEGANASAVRTRLDANADGTVSAAESGAYAGGIRSGFVRETRRPNITLDGRSLSRLTYGFELQGAEGSVTGTSPVRFTMTQAIEFPQPEARGSHSYGFESAIGGDDPWENDPMGDDPWGDECIGGDEPWENVFLDGVVPWGAQAIGGDEPWDNVASVTVRIEAPDGWRFATDGWPAGMKDLLDEDGDVLEMDAEATSSSYATTVGKMSILRFEQLSDDGDGDGGFLPSYGAALALSATVIMAALVMRRRGRPAGP